MRDRRTKRDLHGLDEDGMVICNPRDREAAHRAEAEGIATVHLHAMTCAKCLDRMTGEQRRGGGGSRGAVNRTGSGVRSRYASRMRRWDLNERDSRPPRPSPAPRW